MKAIHIILSIIIIAIIAFFLLFNIEKIIFRPTESTVQTGQTENNLLEMDIIAQDLEIPWEITFLPSGEILITERTGKLLIINSITKERQEIEIPEVSSKGEGGLLGMTLHPDFNKNNLIYLYITNNDNGNINNKINRYKLIDKNLTNKITILDNIPGAKYHDGGRIDFGPDEYLYVTTGDATKPKLSQDLNSLAGKILRLHDDGKIPKDNPFNSAIYSYGHRNPQGLAWDSEGNLWATEHGASSGQDELNLIIKGGNYGWPTIRGDETQSGMITSKINSGSSDTWAPSGIAYHDNSLLFVGLRGESLFQAKIKNGEVTELLAHYRKELGRLRAVVIGPNEKYLYISTSNTDGRGTVRGGGDKIIRIPLSTFK